MLFFNEMKGLLQIVIYLLHLMYNEMSLLGQIMLFDAGIPSAIPTLT